MRTVYVKPNNTRWKIRQTHKDGNFEVIIELDNNLKIVLTDEFIDEILSFPKVL